MKYDYEYFACRFYQARAPIRWLFGRVAAARIWNKKRTTPHLFIKMKGIEILMFNPTFDMELGNEGAVVVEFEGHAVKGNKDDLTMTFL